MIRIADDEADALVAKAGELFGHARADLPVIGTDAAVGIGVLSWGNAYERNFPALQNRCHRAQLRQRRRQNYSVDARLPHTAGPLCSGRRSVVVAGSHDDLILGLAAPLY